MAGKRLITAKVRELSKALTPEQMVQLAMLLTEEAEKPRFDKRQYAKLLRAVSSSYAKLLLAEDALTTFMVEAGQTNDEINTAIAQARHDAERTTTPTAPVKRRGRPRKTVQLDLGNPS